MKHKRSIGEVMPELSTLGFMQVGLEKQCPALVFNFIKIFSISSDLGGRNSNSHPA
jgi:hypothetical protein